MHGRHISYDLNFKDKKSMLFIFLHFSHCHGKAHDGKEFSHGNSKPCCDS